MYRLSGKIGSRAVLYYVTTTLLAVSLGILLTVTIQPGAANTDTVIHSAAEDKQGTAVDTLLDLVTNCFPPNLIQVLFNDTVLRM